MASSLQIVVILLYMNFIIPTCSIVFNATVSLDGSADFKSIGAAIAAAPNNSNSRFYIHVKPGVYKEHVEIQRQKTFIALIGDDATSTIIVDSRSNGSGFGTAKSATFVVGGNNFMAKSITFENSAGPDNGQAVALFNDGVNQTVYYKCIFLGFQDTLFINGDGLFFKECQIYGTVDFIFGNALALFQDCQIYARLPNTTITVTAQSKETQYENSGFSFQNCSVMASPELGSSGNQHKVFDVYLGRPWRNYSTVIFMQSFLDSVVNPKGWSAWSPDGPLNLLYYAEFTNRGPRADLSTRVKWSGFHPINNSNEAAKFTVRKFINRFIWLPETGVPFRPNL